MAFLVVLFIASTPSLLGQSQLFRVKGGLSLSSEFYGSQSDDPDWQPRQQDNISRAILRTSVTIADQVELPFEFYWTNYSRGFRQPFNQFGVSPLLFGWMRLHAGYFSARVSDLTFGDSRLLGGGVELNPGKFRVSALYGRSQDAVQPDASAGFGGQYSRMIAAAKVGYGDEAGTFIHANVAYGLDDSTSITAPVAFDSTGAPVLPPAHKNLVGSLGFGAVFSEKFAMRGEIAASRYVNETRYTGDTAPIGNYDLAGKLSFMITPSATWNLALNAQWIGPGFQTLGYFQMPGDVMEFSAAPSMRLLDNRMMLRGSFGMAFNNLHGQKLETTTRIIGSFGANWQVSDMVNLDAQYSNYGMRAAYQGDSLRIQYVTQSVVLSPSLNFEGLGGTNNVSLSLSLQGVSDGNPVSAPSTENTAQTFSAMHSLALPSTWNFSTAVVYNTFNSTMFGTRILSLNEGVGRQFFNDRLSAQISGGYNIVTTDEGTDGQFSGRVGLAYSFEKWGTLSASLSNNNYRYANSIDRPSFSELYGSIQYSISY